MSLVKVTYDYETGTERPFQKAFAELATYYGISTQIKIDPNKGNISASIRLKEPADKEGIKSALETHGFKKFEIC